MPASSQHRATGQKIKVLIVDDSASVRTTMSNILSEDPDIEVMATASDPYVAAEKIRREVPDVIFLDIEMPRMDGITFLRKIMAQRPIPIVICSSLTAEGSDAMMQALEAGAVDVVTKPRVDTTQFLNESRMRLCDVAKAAAHARVSGIKKAVPKFTVETKLMADVMIPPLSAARRTTLRASLPTTEPVVCIGASTGGTEALAVLLRSLPATSPGIVIVQHMPEKFTGAFAKRLNSMCAVEVREAMDGDPVMPGRVLLAPGNRHMMLTRNGRKYQVKIAEGPYVCRHRPSVDVLFRSASQSAGANALGVLMTGMGDDGARGLLEMREMGSFTIAQDEATSVVYGMPKEAVERGAARLVLPLTKIGAEVLRQTTKGPQDRLAS
ncbi:protein-glutamate methylesterase/protein-glutamine glutaminase [Consotaella aegiceratis]|uniref:protein-glutamate methylesterase/protein-glutamine glutaminase n=1 Tax=Consotaella aegiceratis TaxID=3097961 RepID=UPI002F411D81